MSDYRNSSVANLSHPSEGTDFVKEITIDDGGIIDFERLLPPHDVNQQCTNGVSKGV